MSNIADAKRMNRGVYSLEIPIQYKFIGAEKAIKLKWKWKYVFENIKKKVHKYVKEKNIVIILSFDFESERVYSGIVI